MNRFLKKESLKLQGFLFDWITISPIILFPMDLPEKPSLNSMYPTPIAIKKVQFKYIGSKSPGKIFKSRAEIKFENKRINTVAIRASIKKAANLKPFK